MQMKLIKHNWLVALSMLPLFVLLLINCGGEGGGESGKSGSMARFAISGNALYTVSNTELSTFDISSPQEPVLKDQQYIEGFAETVFAKDKVLFFGTRQGMLIYDASNAFEPRYVSRYEHVNSCDPVVVSKNIAFVTLNSGSWDCNRGLNQLDLIDLSDINNPTLIHSYDMVSPKGLGVDGDILFVCDDGLKAFHVENFYAIEKIGDFDVDAYDVIPDDDYLLLIGTDGLHQYKYTDKGILRVSSIYVN